MGIAFETRAINQQKDLSFFKARYPIEEIDRPSISALLDDSASAFWRDTIAKRWKPLPRFLPGKHWANQPIAYGPDWYAQWNNPANPDPVVEFLRINVPWSEDLVVFAVMDGSTIYKMTWGLFLRYWPTFLFKNEDVIIVRSSHPTFVRFVETGVLFTGQRELKSELDQESNSPNESRIVTANE